MGRQKRGESTSNLKVSFCCQNPKPLEDNESLPIFTFTLSVYAGCTVHCTQMTRKWRYPNSGFVLQQVSANAAQRVTNLAGKTVWINFCSDAEVKFWDLKDKIFR